MRNYFLITAVVSAALSMTSCGNKEKDEPNTFAGVYYDEKMSDREYIENVASAVLDFVKPGEQRDAITALNAFAELCETYDMPDNFIDGPSSDLSRAVADMLERGDYMTASRAANTFVYTLARFKGMYQASPDTYVWRRIEDRDDVLFRYWIGTTEYNLTVSGSGSGGTLKVTDGNDAYSIELPKDINCTLIRGSLSNPTSLITIKLQTSFSDGQSINATSSFRVGSIEVDIASSGNNTKLTEDVTLYRHDPGSMVRTLLLSSTTSFGGSSICSVQAWKDAIERDASESMISTVSTTAMIYGSIQIKCNVNSVKAFIDNADEYWASDYCDNPKEQAEKAATSLESTVRGELRYYGDNNDKLRGTLGWEAYQTGDWAEYEEWSVRPTITFAKDGSTYDFCSYFGNSHFLSVENSIKSIINSYKSYWK